MASMDSKNTIYAAPDASDGKGTWSNGDVAFTDAIPTSPSGKTLRRLLTAGEAGCETRM